MINELFAKKKRYESSLNLIYDNNIHNLRQKVRILIVDDEHFDIIDLLRERKYDIYYIKDITYAIEAEPFDIVIIDILGIGKAIGSGMEGFAVAKEIKKRFPAKQVWCYSGSVIKQEISAQLQEIDGYIPKDTELDKWVEKLDSIISRYCSKEYQEDVLREQLKKCGVDHKDIEKIICEYRAGREGKNFNNFTNILPEYIKSGKYVIELIKLIYSFASLFAA